MQRLGTNPSLYIMLAACKRFCPVVPPKQRLITATLSRTSLFRHPDVLQNSVNPKNSPVLCSTGCDASQSLDGVIAIQDTLCTGCAPNDLQIPYQSDLKISQNGTQSSLTYDTLELGQLHSTSDGGNVHLINVKCQTATIDNRGAGDIRISKGFQGSLSVGMCQGDFTADRIQADRLEFRADACGVVAVSALYASAARFTSASGSYDLGDVHGVTEVAISDTGSVHVGSVSGGLSVRLCYGTVTAHLALPGNVTVDVAEGDISVSVGPDVCTVLDLQGSGVEIDTALMPRITAMCNDEMPHYQRVTGRLGSHDEECDATCTLHVKRGAVKLTASSWIDSVLGHLSKDSR